MADSQSGEYMVVSSRIPSVLLQDEVTGANSGLWLEEMTRILDYYKIYSQGKEFLTEGSNGDYVSADLKFKKSASLINKEARFMFSKTPVIKVISEDLKANTATIDNDMSILQSLVDAVLKSNMFSRKLVQGAKDCFIGKRVAIMLNFNENTGINVVFVPSPEFIYEVDAMDSDVLTKIVTFAMTNDAKSNMDQRIYKKKYEMHDDGYCYVSEKEYDGAGTLLRTIIENSKTKFEYIPAIVIVNDGLTGDILGESDIAALSDYESWYSRLANADIDSERKGMNPTRYAIDADPASTKELSIAAGSFWDISSDPNSQNPNAKASLGIIEPSMGYSESLKTTLDRVKNTMYDTIDMPDMTLDNMQGVITSGKALRILYWPLTVRCDEKMLAWRPALEFIVKTIIEGSKLYPATATFYISERVPVNDDYSIVVQNVYSFPSEEDTEKQTNIAEVTAQVMSRKTYMKKWLDMTDDEADVELEQIAKERQLLEDSYGQMPPVGLE